MSKVNIPKSNIDSCFRYKREIIKIQILNNNGGVTKLVNIEGIATTLNISVKDILSYFKKKLNVTIIEKELIIKKVETVNKLEELLEEYIKINILCPKCANPEFTEEINKKTKVKICKACGFSRES
jgi:translation initiation factor 2 beta subunit (eIF-2beta)/eIF-5